MWPIEPPVTYHDGDKIEPAIVERGGVVRVYRTFTVNRKEPVKIYRRMVKGDCTKSCDVRDLPGSTVINEPGEYSNHSRPFDLPDDMNPGVWRTEFTIVWENRMGMDKSMKLRDLTFTVK
jgi:hypothetical protein